MKKYYSIGEVANYTGMPIYLIRYLEKYGVVSSVRSGVGKHRRYTPYDLNRMLIVKRLHESGLKPKAIKKKLKESKRPELFDTHKLKILKLLDEIRALLEEL
ncbi:MAG: MerR family transcriptional regulator [bacterium]|nr:MerR family transcriptional regulator [bacterium]